MQTVSLVNLFNQLKGSGKCIRFGDLMKRGFNADLIKVAVERCEIELGLDGEGYTIVVFN
ncbi:hypothetical protein [Virgibacillus salexigens]|uniref:Uncharacterized protein n=1 Tax=Virgibacillus massiliensis TaxID=1462526 RepID=A0A024QIQ9_9BACI|nr:hypothetical protein [Virgibacillus massiliensis]CDQ41846.1 hypothetical protein BN990_04225 [Virgibacillus massiliensis]